MKPKEYIKKYNLEKGWNRGIQDQFLAELTIELMSYLEAVNALDSPRKFDNGIDMIRTKWDAISKKIPYGIPDGVWNYYYATTLINIRKEILPKETARMEREREERRLEREERKRRQEEWEAKAKKWREERQRQWERLQEAYFRMLFGAVTLPPVTSFQLLGLTSNATADEVRSKYRELAIKYHPDRGGSQEKFVEITEAKNKCLAYLSR